MTRKSFVVAIFAVLLGPATAMAASSFSQSNLIQVQSPSSIVPTYPGYSFGGGSTVAPYSTATKYLPQNIAVGSDGNMYQAVATTTGNNPTTDTGANWLAFYVRNPITLNIPSRFANFPAAWNFIASSTLRATTTIQFAAQFYSLALDTHYTINHPDGQYIAIMGSTTNPMSTRIYDPGPSVAFGPGSGPFPGDGSLFNINRGNKIGFIDGLWLLGPGIATSTVYGFNGIQAWDGSVATLGTHMVIQNFYAELFANEGSVINAASTTASGGGDGNIWAYGNSMIDCVSCRSTGAGTYFSGSGFLSDNDSYINLSNASAGGNLNGLSLYENSSAQVGGATFGGAGAGGNNSGSSITFNYSAIGNVEGGATYNDPSPMRFSTANYIQGCSQSSDSNTQLMVCSNGNYSQAIWNNNNNGLIASVNKSGSSGFGDGTNTAMGAQVWGTGGVPLRLGAGGKFQAVIDLGGRWGIGSTTPFAKFGIQATSTDTYTTMFAIASSTASSFTTLYSIDSAGTIISGVGSTASSTQSVIGKWQQEFYDAGGTKRCQFYNAAGTLVAVAGACNR